MKTIQNYLLLFWILLLTTSCASIRVKTDYDRSIDYSRYKTFAFYKTGIKDVEINDLDKKRIMRALETELQAKGLTPSGTPDLLVNFSAKSEDNINVDYWNVGYGWGPFSYGMSRPSVSKSTEGTLLIDLIDASKKELVWQGIGEGILTQNPEKKEALIQEFVAKIMKKYPPSY